MFGTNVPKLINLITEELEIELKCRAGELERKYYELNELTPEEQEREGIFFIWLQVFQSQKYLKCRIKISKISDTNNSKSFY